MAYSNWGAFVCKNGERRFDKEDVAVFNTDEKDCPSGFRIFQNILKNKEKYGNDDCPFFEHSHHAVLGDGIVRLCGYKCTPHLYIIDDNVVKKIDIPEAKHDWNDDEDEWDHTAQGEIKVDNKIWKWKFREIGEGNMIELKLVEPDGNMWNATCGFEYGAGFMD